MYIITTSMIQGILWKESEKIIGVRDQQISCEKYKYDTTATWLTKQVPINKNNNRHAKI